MNWTEKLNYNQKIADFFKSHFASIANQGRLYAGNAEPWSEPDRISLDINNERRFNLYIFVLDPN